MTFKLIITNTNIINNYYHEAYSFLLFIVIETVNLHLQQISDSPNSTTGPVYSSLKGGT